ncbi:hypothetical protein E2P42_02865 [Candidatus Bathyarchaeota archaeon]|nr:hypothetical protein E2P42_02865 [Candidatus Bathyarchaeota archaeon]
MRHTRSKRGQMRVIEVILASVIIISALSFVTMFSSTPTTPKFEVSDLEKLGYSALLDLDHQGLLAPNVYTQSWNELRMVLKITLPVDVYFNLAVYDPTSEPWTKANGNNQIMYGAEETFSSSKNIASVSYALTGYKSGTPGNFIAQYNPRILVLQLTRG